MFYFFFLLDKNNSLYLSMSWVKKLRAELCVWIQSSFLFFFLFQAACFCPLFPSCFSPLVAVEATAPSKPFSPVVLVIRCKYPKRVSFYILYFCRHWEVLLWLCEACNSGKSQYRSQRTARREMFNLTLFILLCLSQSFS